jgi:hypothetical protein
MARPRKLTSVQEAELRGMAVAARAESRYRGHGSCQGRQGLNATEALWIEAAERFGIELSVRSIQRLLNELGLEYWRRGQGGIWLEARR